MDNSDREAAETNECVRQASAWQERKLVHWVNSLPLPKCLLVETLADLRFGDVLLDIVRCLQHKESQHAEPPDEHCGYPLASIERLRLVLQFVARESRSADQEAMFLVNEARCAERVKRGDRDAICAVVSILKRIACERQTVREMTRDRKDEEAMHQSMVYLAIEREVQRREKSRDSCAASSHNDTAAAATSAGAVDVAKKKQSERKLHIVGLPSARFGNEVSGRASRSNRSSPLKENFNADMKAKSRAVSLQEERTPRLKTPTPRKPSEALSLDHDKNSFPIFHDDKGVLHIYGMIDPSATKNKPLDRSKSTRDATKMTAKPSKHLVRQATIRVGKPQVNNDAMVAQHTEDARMSGVANTNSETMLLGVESGDENSKLSVNVSQGRQHLLPLHDHGTRRIYITKEQMQSVNRWLETIDKSLFEV
ncbi:hypothetical protein FI667_g8937, partial [Globisporangium splendens]